MFNDDAMFPDILTLEKTTGERINNIRGQVDHNKIITQSADFDLDAGDILVRTRPSGKKERYEVLSPGFQPAMLDFPNHYQAEVKLCGAVSRPSVIDRHVTFIGNNSRYNENSVDNSTNAVNHGQMDMQVFKDLLDAAMKIEDQTDRQQILDAIHKLEKSIGNEKAFKGNFIELMTTAGKYIDLFKKSVGILKDWFMR